MTPFRSEKDTNWEGAFRVPLLVRWPGKIPAGVVSNEIVQHHDWLPTFCAMAGDADIPKKLLKGHKAGDKTFKVHIDGYNLLPFLTGEGREEPAPRASSTSTTTATASRSATRTGRPSSWSSAARGRWRSGSSRSRVLRVPKLYNLRTDPFERADITSNTYWDWYMSKVYMIMAAQAIVAEVPRDVQGRTRRARRRRASRSTRRWRRCRSPSTPGTEPRNPLRPGPALDPDAIDPAS